MPNINRVRGRADGIRGHDFFHPVLRLGHDFFRLVSRRGHAFFDRFCDSVMNFLTKIDLLKLIFGTDFTRGHEFFGRFSDGVMNFFSQFSDGVMTFFSWFADGVVTFLTAEKSIRPTPYPD